MKTIIPIDLYSCKVIFIVTKDIKKELYSVYKENGQKIKIEGYMEGFSISFAMDVYYIVINKDFLTHNTIAHELFHGVMKITEDRFIKEEESRAWLSGYITESVYKALKKHKLTIS